MQNIFLNNDNFQYSFLLSLQKCVFNINLHVLFHVNYLTKLLNVSNLYPMGIH